MPSGMGKQPVPRLQFAECLQLALEIHIFLSQDCFPA
jgi:hypothetical protein